MVGEADWWLEVVPVELEEQGSEGQVPALSPVSAEEWACCPGSTSPRSGGKCLEDRDIASVETNLKGYGKKL